MDNPDKNIINPGNNPGNENEDIFEDLFSKDNFEVSDANAASQQAILFAEEFDKSKVVNKPENDLNKKKSKDLDIDSLLSYNKDSITKTKFVSLADSPITEENETLEKQFKDFLILPRISGRAGNFPHGNKIPSENITDNHGSVEIADSPISSEGRDPNISSVFINRDKNGEIVSLEVLCKCGEKTKIEFEYKDLPNSPQSDGG
jgi:hypothetical protein